MTAHIQSVKTADDVRAAPVVPLVLVSELPPAVPPVLSPVVLTVGVDFTVTDTLVPTSASIVALSGLAAMAELTAVARLDIETEVSEDSAAVLCASVAWIV